MNNLPFEKPFFHKKLVAKNELFIRFSPLHLLTTIHIFIDVNYGFFVIDNWFLLFDEKCDILSDSCS